MASSTHTVKRGVIAFLERREEASVQDIAKALGGDWLLMANRPRLIKLLLRMVKRKLLENNRHGVYRLSKTYYWRGLDSKDHLETCIALFLGGRGVAETREILVAVGNDPDKRGYENRVALEVLRRSPRFQPAGRGFWKLTEVAMVAEEGAATRAVNSKLSRIVVQ